MTVLALMQTKSSNPAVAAEADAQIKLDELTRFNRQLSEKTAEIVRLFNKVQWNQSNSWITSYIDQWVVFHQTFPAGSVAFWGSSALSESSGWFLKQPKSDLITKISASRAEFEKLYQRYTLFTGQMCWYESTEFSYNKPWPKQEDPLSRIAERYTKTAHYANRMKSALDPLCKSMANASFS